MKIIISFFIFCLVLFLYLHIQFHLKKSNDLEIYEISQPSKEKLEEICDLRQPVLFDFECDKITSSINREYLIQNYSAFDVKIRNVKDVGVDAELYVPLQLKCADKLFNEDKENVFFSEKNVDFLDDTGMLKNMKYNDEFLRPHMVSNCEYDFIFGSDQICTPFKYEINYRNYFIVTQGSVKIKLAPPQSIKYLNPVHDYDNFEFKTIINPWNTQMKHQSDFNKIKCLEFDMTTSKTLYIPAYWWYSIKFSKNATIASLKYRTYMNNFAIFPYIGMYALQMQNVKRNTFQKINMNELNNYKKKQVVISDDISISNDNNNNKGNINSNSNINGNINGNINSNSNVKDVMLNLDETLYNFQTNDVQINGPGTGTE